MDARRRWATNPVILGFRKVRNPSSGVYWSQLDDSNSAGRKPRTTIPMRLFVFLLVILLSCAGPLAKARGQQEPSPPGRAADRILAIVGKEVFTARDMDKWIVEARLRDPRNLEIPDEQLRQEMLARAIDDFLLAGWAEREVEEPPEEAVEAQTQEAIARLEQAAQGQGELNDLLRESGIEPREFRTWIKERAKRSMLISDALAAFADLGGRNPADTSPENADRVRLAHIFIQPGAGSDGRKKALEKALAIRRDLEKGISFVRAASLYSDDRYTADRGGSLGWFTRGEASPAIWQAATRLSPGEISAPVETENGFHLVRLIDYETPQQREYLRLMQEEEWRRLAQLREEIGIRLAPGYELQPIPEEFQKPQNEERSDGPSDPDGI